MSKHIVCLPAMGGEKSTTISQHLYLERQKELHYFCFICFCVPSMLCHVYPVIACMMSFPY